MERDSILYKIRRKGQVLAQKVVSPEVMSKFYSRIVLKKKVDLKNPKTFNEKIQWCKIHYYPNNVLVIQGADKYAVREYIKGKGLGNILVPIYGHWENPDDIDWDELPNKFVLKCNHGCAYNLLCSDKNELDKKTVVKQLKDWLREDFGTFNVELHYSKIKPRLVTCEQYLGDSITDYKFFCFNGKPQYMYVSKDFYHDRQAQVGFFYLDGSKMPLTRDDYADIESVIFPEYYDEMLQAAEILAKDFKFVRVDFFLANDTYYFAELTFSPSAGMMPFNPDEFDLEWGNLLDIGDLK